MQQTLQNVLSIDRAKLPSVAELEHPLVLEILDHWEQHGAPPKASSMEEVLLRVGEFIAFLNTYGGQVQIPFVLDQKPRYDAEESPLRFSSAGKCGRALAYKKLHPEQAESLTVRSLSVFMLGHAIHDLERALIRLVVPLRNVEDTVTLELNGETVEGHMDGIIELESGPVLLDVKTTSDASFDRMLREGPSYDYAAQLNLYMHAAGLEAGFLWLYNKNTSSRFILEVPKDPKLIEEVLARWTQVQQATPDNLPDRMYTFQSETRKGKPTGRDYLPWQCGYCQFVSTCWSQEGFEKVVEGGKTRWIREV
ncbi:MAG: PD-(D/E)XK nuclease family protein [Meiothermus sp.]|nr:PD-(D/E)XK nuclease family protein [Meiothermus sp.]